MITVGIGDMQFTRNAGETLITHALGSCIGIAIYDPEAGVGGLLHYLLPLDRHHGDAAKEDPLKFGSLAIPELFKKAYTLGADKSRLKVYMAGGAAPNTGMENHFDIGRKNIAIARKLFLKNRVLLSGEDTGGTHPRTMVLTMTNGHVTVRTNGVETSLTTGGSHGL